MSITSRIVLGAAVAAAVCLSAAGCGSQGSSSGGAVKQAAKPADPLARLTARQIAAKAASGLQSAPSFTLSGTGVVVDNQKGTVSIGVKGSACAMTVDTGPKGSMTMTMIGKTAWMKADATFWKSQAGAGADSGAVAGMFAGKYVKLPASSGSQLSATAGLCDAKQLSGAASEFALPPDAAKGAVSTVNGQRVYSLGDKAGKMTWYVTDTPSPRIVKFVSTEPGSAGQFTITYGVPKSITAPPASETVTMPGLGS